MSLESIYTYKPKGSAGVKSSSDYIQQKFPETAAERIKSFGASKDLLSRVSREYRAEASQNIKRSLQEWLATPSKYVHSSIIMHTHEGILDFDNKDWLVAKTYARECPNLKTVLRNVTNRFTDRVTDSDRRLMYDFEVLTNHLKTRPEGTLYIIHLEDADVFEPQVINELVEYISGYPELPIRLAMTLSVPPRAFEERLSRQVIEKIDVRLFEQEASSKFLYRAAESLYGPDGVLFGNKLLNAMDSISQETMFKVLNYFLLVHFSTNPLANLKRSNIPEHLPLIRRLPSFRRIATAELISDNTLLIGATEQALDSLNPDYSGFLEEVIINDAELYYNIFTPNYRHALETALAEPKYYYPFQDPQDLRGNIPVCQLYSAVRGASLFLNVYDHYVEFRDSMARPEGLSDEEWPRVAAAWYQQAVTELKGMGVLRSTKRKANSVEKVAYKGV